MRCSLTAVWSTDAYAQAGKTDPDITKRRDKGKGRAEPEPEPVESILSPTFLISESDDEDGEGTPVVADPEDLVSPTDL